MGLREIESMLPPGFRFYPSDEELVCHYLYKKVANERTSQGTLVDVDLHTREPWELPDVAKLSANEWYFFSFRDRKYATGSRTNRATKSGYWKATGKDRTVYEPTTHALVGMRKTLVFYQGRAPNGIKTGWVMHEFRLENPHMPPREDWVLCRVFHKRKGETVRYGLESEQDNAGSSSPNLESSSPPSMTDQGVNDGYEQQQQLVPYGCHPPLRHRQLPDDTSGQNYGFLNMAAWHYDFVDFPQGGVDGAHFAGVDARGAGDEYGFLLDVGGLGGDDMKDVEMMSSFEDMRFPDATDKAVFF
ncbi:hypothetical protein Taro_029673 [Colocasia esculenta]|uniref:NAC domain-containing protein n=1 Tax=Colocasia esculenta TaxID=4460 RepID=A0A843VRU4_COLES|nr:hypothetical protein [Colocasia esculenta]